jgi:hypothetical protein
LSFILKFYSMDRTRPYAIARSIFFCPLPNRGGEWRSRGGEMLRDLDLGSTPAFSFARVPASAGFDEIGAHAPPSVAGFEGDFEAIDQILAANDHVIETVCQRLPGLCGNVQSAWRYTSTLPFITRAPCPAALHPLRARSLNVILEKRLSRPSARLFAINALLLALVATWPINAATAPPENARADQYGSGWQCKRGFAKNNDTCVPFKLPANAYLSASGMSWSCNRGFLKVDAGCRTVEVPPHAYADDSGAERGWTCNRGYRRVEGACAQVIVPQNAYALDTTYGLGWQCSRGYRANKGACIPVEVPKNGFLTQSGDDWKCDRGYARTDDACVSVTVPANGFLDSSGKGWKCERGYQRDETTCLALQVPANGYLDYSGNDWRCENGFRKNGAVCHAEE